MISITINIANNNFSLSIQTFVIIVTIIIIIIINAISYDVKVVLLTYLA